MSAPVPPSAAALPSPSIQPSRYLDRFVRTTVGARLAKSRVFPNAKEVTESYAARAAALRFRAEFPPADPHILLIAVADGSTPRTAATFALHTAWECHSVDPRLRSSRRWAEIPRLTLHPQRIETCRFSAPRAVVVAVHSHVSLASSLASVFAEDLLVIAMPCCLPIDLNEPVDLSFDDAHVLSARRTIHVWSLPHGRPCASETVGADT
ncbi:hypothetical protein ABN028_26665 [Actinopolymorpha sp. B17G11]|uniref:hypothetical protein n=1 Tax=Actinopolymorpha sp. B17G11 TaxID=3160861 RepID=UPI0032E40564